MKLNAENNVLGNHSRFSRTLGMAVAFALIVAAVGFSLGRPVRQASAATRTLYVSTTGSDSTGDGTQAKPWQTISKAAGLVVAGDTVLIAPGTYAESITIDDKHGTSGNPITFLASGPGVVIDGTASSRDAVFVTFSSYVVLDGWRVQQAPRAGLRIDNSNHVTARNGVYANNGRWGIFTDFSDDLVIEYNEAYGSVAE